MKSKKTNTLLAIIAINLTLIMLFQFGIFPTQAHANTSINPINENYTIVPINKNGKIEVEISQQQLDEIKANIRDDDYIISRILYCLDGASVGNETISTYCNN